LNGCGEALCKSQSKVLAGGRAHNFSPCPALPLRPPRQTLNTRLKHEHLRELFAALPKLMVDFRAAVAKEAAEDRELTSLCNRALIEAFKGVR
jgi:hypothetical protein